MGSMSLLPGDRGSMGEYSARGGGKGSVSLCLVSAAPAELVISGSSLARRARGRCWRRAPTTASRGYGRRMVSRPPPRAGARVVGRGGGERTPPDSDGAHCAASHPRALQVTWPAPWGSTKGPSLP